MCLTYLHKDVLPLEELSLGWLGGSSLLKRREKVQDQKFYYGIQALIRW